jgi:hypothetical protein
MSLATLKGGITVGYSINQFGKGVLINDPSHISDDEYVVFSEFTADSFEELPTEGVKLGDRAIFNDNGKLAIAVFFTGGWVRSE